MKGEALTEPIENESLEFYGPAVEVVIHNARLEVKKIPIAPNEFMTLLRFHTPTVVYTVKLDDNGANVIADNLRGVSGTPDIVIAAPGDVPKLKG